MEKHVLDQISDPRLRTYVVWVPVLRGRPVEDAARGISDYVSDERALQYVDVDGALSRAYAPVVSLPPPLPAWDVYFAFGPDAHWPDEQGSKPPKPDYWMHQLGRAAPAELLLDADKLNLYVSGKLLKMGR